MPITLVYYAAAFLGGYLVGRFTRRGAPQAAEAVMGGLAKLAQSGALDSVGSLDVSSGSDKDGVSIKITTRGQPPVAPVVPLRRVAPPS